MKKQRFFLTFAFTAIFSLFLSSCGTDPVEYDESGNLGTYVGYHRLIDSASLSGILGDVDYSFYDTLVVTNGSSTTDGKLNAKSSYLGGSTIEIVISNTPATVTPKLVGTLDIDGTILTDAKIGSGSTASWNTDKTVVSVKLNAGATYGVIVLPPSLRLWGDFTKL